MSSPPPRSLIAPSCCRQRSSCSATAFVTRRWAHTARRANVTCGRARRKQQKRSHAACLVSDTARNMSTKAHAADVAMPAQVLNDSVVEGRRRGWPLSEALSVSTNPCKPTALLSTQLSPALLCSSLLDCAEVPFIPQQSVAKQSWNVLREPKPLQSGGACPQHSRKSRRMFEGGEALYKAATSKTRRWDS